MHAVLEHRRQRPSSQLHVGGCGRKRTEPLVEMQKVVIRQLEQTLCQVCHDEKHIWVRELQANHSCADTATQQLSQRTRQNTARLQSRSSRTSLQKSSRATCSRLRSGLASRLGSVSPVSHTLSLSWTSASSQNQCGKTSNPTCLSSSSISSSPFSASPTRTLSSSRRSHPSTCTAS